MPNNISRLKTSLSKGDVIGVAVTITEEHRNTHTGIAYRDQAGRIKILHLRFHYDLADEDIDPSYLCAVPDLDAEDQEIIAGHCRSIARDKPPIWFAIRADAKTRLVVRNGKFGLTNHREGMNCSTFVMAVFHFAGPTLVDLTEWRKRESDRLWHEQLVKWLKEKKPPRPPIWYVNKVEKDIGCARVRPEEVAGACLEDYHPVAFAECERNGKIVLQATAKHTHRNSKW
jgi:hypothetical protein